MRFRPIFLAVIFVTCAMWMQTHAKAQSADVQSVAEFLAICRSHVTTLKAEAVLTCADAPAHSPQRWASEEPRRAELSEWVRWRGT